MSEKLHADAVLARLAAAPGSPAMVVHDDSVPSGSVPPYVTVRFYFRQLTASESPGTTSLSFESVTWRIEVRTHSVGSDARSTRAVKGRVRAQLLNWVPTVAGRSCSALRQIDTDSLAPNEQMGVSIAEQADTYRFQSQPA